MKLFDVFRLSFSFCVAAIAQYYAKLSAYDFRGYDSVGGETAVFPMVLILSCLIMEGIRRLVNYGRKKWKMA